MDFFELHRPESMEFKADPGMMEMLKQEHTMFCQDTPDELLPPHLQRFGPCNK